MIMNFIFRILAGLLLWLPLISQQSITLIEGKALSENQKVVLKAFDANTLAYFQVKEQTLDSDNTFHFDLSITQPNLYQLEFDDGKNLVLSVEPSASIQVQRDSTGVSIEGSPESSKIQTFGQEIQQLQAHYFGDLKKELDHAMANEEQEKAEALMKKANEAIPLFVKDLRAKIIDMGINPGGYFAMQFSDFNKEQVFLQERLEAFRKSIPQSPVTKALEKQLAQASATAIGKAPPTISAIDQKGNKVTLDQFKNKILLVDFWASWCRACRVENPKFLEVYHEFDRATFEILSISNDKGPEKWMQAKKKDGISKWFHVLDAEEKIFNAYGVSSLPQNIVIGKSGRIIAKNVDAGSLRQLIIKELE